MRTAAVTHFIGNFIKGLTRHIPEALLFFSTFCSIINRSMVVSCELENKRLKCA